MNVVRVNMSHATHAELSETIKIVAKVNRDQHEEYGPIGVLLDTQGPEIRTGESDQNLDLKVGEIINLTVRDTKDVETSSIKINYSGLIKSVKKGSKITIDNGLINFIVLDKDQFNLKCRVIDGGKLGSKRHVNLPGVRVDLPSITKKDKKDDKKESKSQKPPTPAGPNIVKVPSRNRGITDPRMQSMMEKGLEYLNKMDDNEKKEQIMKRLESLQSGQYKLKSNIDQNERRRQYDEWRKSRERKK